MCRQYRRSSTSCSVEACAHLGSDIESPRHRATGVGTFRGHTRSSWWHRAMGYLDPRGYLDRDRADSFSRRGGVSQFRLTVPQVCSSRATCEIIEAMSIEPASAIEAMSIEPVTAAVFDRWIVGVVGGITAFYGALHARWSFDFKALQPGTTRRPRVSLSTKGVRGTSFFIPFRHLGSLCFPTRRF